MDQQTDMREALYNSSKWGYKEFTVSKS